MYEIPPAKCSVVCVTRTIIMTKRRSKCKCKYISANTSIAIRHYNWYQYPGLHWWLVLALASLSVLVSLKLAVVSALTSIWVLVSTLMPVSARMLMAYSAGFEKTRHALFFQTPGGVIITATGHKQIVGHLCIRPSLNIHNSTP